MNASDPPTKKPGPGWSVMAAGGLALVGLFLHYAQTQSTSEFREFGNPTVLFYTIASTVLLVPICGVLALVNTWLHKRDKWPKWLSGRTIAGTGVILSLTGAATGWYGSLPRVRCAEHVGIAADRISDVRVVGFRSVIASRWLFSFTTSADNVALIVASLGLEQAPDVDLRKSLENDVVFAKTGLIEDFAVPGSGRLKSYATSSPREGSVSWITLVFDEGKQRAWLSKGYQN